MKRYILILFMVMVVAVSGCTSEDSGTENQTKTFTANNISFEYPSDWVTANSLANDTVAAVGDPSSVDSSGLAQVSVVIQSKDLKGNLYDMYRANYEAFSQIQVTGGSRRPTQPSEVIRPSKTSTQSHPAEHRKSRGQYG